MRVKVVGEIITHLLKNASHSGGGKAEVGLGEGNNLGMELVDSNVVYGKRQPWCMYVCMYVLAMFRLCVSLY